MIILIYMFLLFHTYIFTAPQPGNDGSCGHRRRRHGVLYDDDGTRRPWTSVPAYRSQELPYHTFIHFLTEKENKIALHRLKSTLSIVVEAVDIK